MGDRTDGSDEFVSPEEDEMRYEQELEHKLLEAVAPHAAQLDPNWRSVHFRQDLTSRSFWVNGPARGDISLPPVETIVPEELVVEFLDYPFRTVFNPKHQIVLKANEVLIMFEYGEYGYVRTVDTTNVIVQNITLGFEEIHPLEKFMGELRSQDRSIPSFLREDGVPGAVVDLHYCPCRFEQSRYGSQLFRNGPEFEFAERSWSERDPNLEESPEDFQRRVAQEIARVRT